MEIRLMVHGDRACFRRPEFVEDLVSYDVITPHAARGLFEAIHAAPDLRWMIDEIRVLRPIRFTWMALAEVEAGDPGGPLPPRIAGPADRRLAHVLSDVAYVVTAHGESMQADGHLQRFRLAAAAGRPFRAPFLGLRSFPAEVSVLAPDAPLPPSALAASGAIDLGWMLYDTEREARGGVRLYRPTMIDGVIDLRCRDALILAG